jgi:hypothetical protein
MTGVHRDRVHDPGHHLRVRPHVGSGDVLLGPDEDRYLGRVATGQVLELVQRQLARVARDRALGSAVRKPDRRALPRHQHRQRLDQVEVDRGVITDAALGRAAADVVLYAPAREHVHGPVVHANREVDGQLALDVTQAAASVVGESDDISRGIEPPLCGLEGGGAGFDRHFGTSDTTPGRTMGPCPASTCSASSWLPRSRSSPVSSSRDRSRPSC